MNTFYYHIKLLRPLNVFTSGLAMVIGSGILGTFNNTGTLLLVMAVVMCFAGAANALNDVVDYEIEDFQVSIAIHNREEFFIDIINLDISLFLDAGGVDINYINQYKN